jgi:hypothetical protein
MAHFAKLDHKNVVTQVIVVSNETLNFFPFPASEPIGQAFCESLFRDGATWKQTSYTAKFRKNYAGIDFIYYEALDAFAPPKPFPSWLLNEETVMWEAPAPYPTDGGEYEWDEPSLSWVAVAEEPATNNLAGDVGA